MLSVQRMEVVVHDLAEGSEGRTGADRDARDGLEGRARLDPDISADPDLGATRGV